MVSTSDKPKFKLWEECDKRGYVTRLCDVTELNPFALADRLGFEHHLMVDGYALLLLLSSVARHDFIWRDTTRFSAGWVKERVYFKNGQWSDEYVQRADQERFRSYQRAKFESEESWASFLSEQTKILNVRRGSNRIVKIVPFGAGEKGDYPDARNSCARQWELTVLKRFVCAGRFWHGRVIHNGEFDSSYLT